VAEVESEAESACETCATPNPAGPLNSNAPACSVISRAEHASLGSPPWVLRSTVNEGAVFYEKSFANARWRASPNPLRFTPTLWRHTTRSARHTWTSRPPITEIGKVTSPEQEWSSRDDGKPPAAVIAFRNESQLPLRVGFVIDTSTSITKQFAL
jgi:hypothetical protein